MNKENRLTISGVISLLRFPLILCVVIIHSRFTLDEITGACDEWPFHLMDFISGKLLLFVNPLFFLISGYLFFLNGNLERKKDWINKYKRRIRSLLVPYVIWNLIGVALFLLKYLPIINNFFPGLKGVKLDFPLLLSCFWSIDLGGDANPINYPLWFLRDLMIVVLIAPFIHLFIKNKYSIWLLLILSTLSVNIIGYIAFIYFSIGAYLAINKVDLSMFYYHSVYVIFISISILTCLCFWWNNIYVSSLLCSWYILSCIVLIFGLVKIKCFHVCMKSGFVFFLFVSHGLIITYVKRMIIVLMPKFSIFLFLDYLLIPLCTVLILWCIYQMLYKCCPVFLGYLLGNR